MFFVIVWNNEKRIQKRNFRWNIPLFFFFLLLCLTRYILFQGTIQRCKEMHSQADRTDVRGKNRGRGKVHIQPRSKHERWVLEGIGNLAHTPLCSAINFRHGCSKQTYSLCSISCLRILFYGTTIRSPWIRTIHCAIRMKLHSSLLNVNFNVEHTCGGFQKWTVNPTAIITVKFPVSDQWENKISLPASRCVMQECFIYIINFSREI